MNVRESVPFRLNQVMRRSVRVGCVRKVEERDGHASLYTQTQRNVGPVHQMSWLVICAVLGCIRYEIGSFPDVIVHCPVVDSCALIAMIMGTRT